MTALADLLSPDQRERLTARLRELSEIEALLKEVPEQRPPDAVPALAELAARRQAEPEF